MRRSVAIIGNELMRRFQENFMCNQMAMKIIERDWVQAQIQSRDDRIVLISNVAINYYMNSAVERGRLAASSSSANALAFCKKLRDSQVTFLKFLRFNVDL
jgi:hypothetical protein